VVAKLLAALRVAAGGLEMAARVGADPYVGPGGWDGERADSLQRRFIAEDLPFRVEVREPAAGPRSPDRRPCIRRVDEAILPQVGLGVGRYVFSAWALLIFAARVLLMPLRFNASCVSFFLIEWVFFPGLSR
jgi:hypothetical protein